MIVIEIKVLRVFTLLSDFTRSDPEAATLYDSLLGYLLSEVVEISISERLLARITAAQLTGEPS